MTLPSKQVPIPPRGVDYRGKVVLAPMVRSGELPSRLLALEYGADLVWGPETVDRAMIGTTKRFNQHSKTIEWCRESTIFKILPEKEASRLIFQMGTADPERAVQAARMVAEHVAGIDVNAGCPKPFSTSGGMGAALLKTPDKLCAILEALVQNITPEHEIGISVKIRILETAAETEALVRRLCATGITGLTVHCRTTPMRPRERAIRDQLRMVADVCHEFGIACLMNGDVEDRDQGLELAAEFGADGAMIATAAEKNPSCFRSRAQGGLLPWLDVVDNYLKTSMTVENRFGNSKYLLAQMIPGKEKLHQHAAQGKTYSDMCRVLGLNHLAEQAQDADARLGLDKPLEKKKASKKTKANASALAAGGQMGRAREQTQQRRPLSERNASAQPQAERELASVAPV
ncbi:dihydrouridine synthase (Dus) domain-containing protein [Hirsutella rhossiliensis]|uniref:Dihydrouridine synthase (Dus) domain-containing protein n=1 Tax=Hirsutella rhossiliensis TaxID=111463 RepID=A0A9P8MXH1_9HYPO|nr:dihydrouridine synthase (Dus) domain-containing protein [Hirsutella rhossiliensis]KAH0963137.1 dihydrouridine synthase (Dus) domain-containing protein [Hirsutella rhossiliensis]